MKLKKYKDGTIKIVSESSEEAEGLLELYELMKKFNYFKSFEIEIENTKTKTKKERVCPLCGSTNIIMFDSDNDYCNKCKTYFSGA
jgi:ribosomal protein S27AE